MSKIIAKALAKTALFFSVLFALYVCVRLYAIYHGGIAVVIGG